MQNNMDFNRCTTYRNRGYIAMACMGIGFRLMAFIALKISTSRKH